MCWWRNIESHLCLHVIISLHQPAILKHTWKTSFLNFMKLKRTNYGRYKFFWRDYQINPFEDRNGRICHLILAHVLIQMRCCLFPVILISFHRRGRRHYIRAVKMFDRKLSMLYTMIVKPLINCWDNFEQTAKILARC